MRPSQQHCPSASVAQTANAYDYAVVVGRFQPVHTGHVALLQSALQIADKVIVVLGSAYQPRSYKNPFTQQERQHMILGALPIQTHARIFITGIPDVPNDDDAWVCSVRDTVNAAIVADSGNPATTRVALLGHMKDDSSYYLKLFSCWQWLPFDNVAGINATTVRNSYFTTHLASDALWLQPGILPDSTVDFLRQFQNTSDWMALSDTYRLL